MSDAGLLVALLAAATVRGAAPLVLAALGGLFSERSGVVDIGLEGKMLAAAFAAAATAAVTGSAWVGLGAAIAASVLVGLVHGFACVTHHGNQVVSGMALNITVSGLTAVLGFAWFREGGQTPLLGGGARFGPIALPGAAALAPVPGIGLIYSEVVSGHNALVYLAAIAVPVVAWLVYRTRFGLRLRAVGENPGAVDTAGVSVALTRYQGVIASGVLCGLSGAYLSIAHHASFIRDMSAGKGYLALAALIFGQWRPVPTVAGLPPLRLRRRRPDAASGHAAARRRRGAGPAHPGHPVRPDRGPARRLRRTGGGSARHRRPVREGPMSESLEPMLDLARRALANAHAPYSRFRVGACLRTAGGRLYAGCNVENSAYPVGQCAEATAIGAMVAAGDREIAEVVVLTERAELVLALRALPPAARRVRGPGRARSSLRAGGCAAHDDAGRAPADGLRPGLARELLRRCITPGIRRRS